MCHCQRNNDQPGPNYRYRPIAGCELGNLGINVGLMAIEACRTLIYAMPMHHAFRYNSRMEDFILDILARIRELERALAANELEDIVRTHNQGIRDNKSHISKRRALPFFLKVRESDPQRWSSWNISPNEDALLLQTLRMKPRRTASGVATITVITKPWLCSGACIYCPNDVRMPKSYLHNEPACQRAERNCFDPYLQVSSRLRALESMGHVTDKIELIVLGGTWNDYPESYRIWFVRELFRALNDAEESDAKRAGNTREKTPAIVPLDNPLTQRGEASDEIDDVTNSANRPMLRVHSPTKAKPSDARSTTKRAFRTTPIRLLEHAPKPNNAYTKAANRTPRRFVNSTAKTTLGNTYRPCKPPHSTTFSASTSAT